MGLLVLFLYVELYVESLFCCDVVFLLSWFDFAALFWCGLAFLWLCCRYD